jgi:hypothetical protein
MLYEDLYLFSDSHQQPVLDIKPYVPYCDSIQEAAVPNWLMVILHYPLAIFAGGSSFFNICNRFYHFDLQ